MCQENSRKYVEGIRGNLEAIALIYGPEWTMRLYHNLGENDIEELLPFSAAVAGEKQFVLCDINRNPLLGNASRLLPTLWRFLPLLDDQVLFLFLLFFPFYLLLMLACLGQAKFLFCLFEEKILLFPWGTNRPFQLLRLYYSF